MPNNELTFDFDKSSKTFFHSLVCPTCSAEIKDSQSSSSMTDSSSVDFCKSCGTPFEWYKIPSNKNLYWLRRSGQRFCTLSGKDMKGKSLLDTEEYGGGTFRNSSVFDPYCKVFELLGPYHCYKFSLQQKSSFYGKIRHSDLDEDDTNTNVKQSNSHDEITQSISGSDGEQIISLNIVNGFLVSCTNRGELQVFKDILSPRHNKPIHMKKIENPQPWQKSNIEVDFSPAYCGMYSLTIAYSLDAKSLLNFRIINAIRQTTSKTEEDFFEPKSVELENLRVLGPPFKLEICDEPHFAVWCGIKDQRNRVDPSKPPIFTVNDSQIRIYSVSGDLEYIISAPNMARPPLFIRSKKLLVSMNTNFDVLYFNLDKLSDSSVAITTHIFQKSVISPHTTYLLPSIFPTMVAVLNEKGHEEIWLAYNEIDNFQLGIYSFSIQSNKSFSENIPFSSTVGQRNNDYIGELYALSVGHASRSLRADHYSNFLAISTSKFCRIYSKSTLSQVGHDIKSDDYASTSITGTMEPAFFTGAGILVHLAGQVRLDFCTQPDKKIQNIVTKDVIPKELPSHKKMGSSYHTGMTILGRRMFVAHKLSIFVFDLTKKDIEKQS